MKSGGLTELQLAVMKALWSLGEGSVAEILVEMRDGGGRALAPTTVATLLQRLARQGWVRYRRKGRHFIYRANVDQRDAAMSTLRRIINSFFGGKVSALTAQLIESEQISGEDLREMRRLIAKKGG